MALDYTNLKGLRPPKTLLKAIKELRNRDVIVVTKPVKGSGVAVMENPNISASLLPLIYPFLSTQHVISAFLASSFVRNNICTHYLSEHTCNSNVHVPPCLLEQLYELTKCSNKFACLNKEMLFYNFKPSLNVQTESIRAEVFTWRTCDPLLLCVINWCQNGAETSAFNVNIRLLMIKSIIVFLKILFLI